MVLFLKSVGAFACSLLLCLSFSGIASSSSDKMGNVESGKIIKGQVSRIEGANYFVKNREDGKEVRLHIDKNTQMNAVGIIPGANVMAKIDDQNHVLSILTDQSASTILQGKE
jgi:translation initiation factor IF-1